jgi:hypothetical protein
MMLSVELVVSHSALVCAELFSILETPLSAIELAVVLKQLGVWPSTYETWMPEQAIRALLGANALSRAKQPNKTITTVR